MPLALPPSDPDNPLIQWYEEAQAFFTRLTELVSGYFGQMHVRVDGMTEEAWIRIVTEGDRDGTTFGPFAVTGFPRHVIEIEPLKSDVFGIPDVLWSFCRSTYWKLWWPLKLHLVPLESTSALVTLYAGTPIGVQGSRAMPLVAILGPSELEGPLA